VKVTKVEKIIEMRYG